MSRALAALAALFALFAAMAATPARVHACMCAPKTTQAAYDEAVAVFEGHVLEVSPAEAVEAGRPTQKLKVRLQVVSAWKGAEGEEVVVFTAGNSAACGYTFVVDQSYLVYAAAPGGTLEVSLCSRTRPMAQAAEDLAVLGMGSTPVNPNVAPEATPATPKPDEPPARGGCAGCAIAGSASERGAIGLALLVLAIAAARGSRRRFRRSS